MRLAVIDVGTNSVRLLVAEVGPAGRAPGDAAGRASGRRLVELHRALRTTRLGEGGDGLLRPAAMARTVAAIADFVAASRVHGVARVAVAGTSAVREAANRDAFLEMVRETTGQELLVLSGEDEARFGFRGAVGGLPGLRRDAVLTVDIGGGSTEFAWENRVGKVEGLSLPVGAVRLTARDSSFKEIQQLLEPAFTRLGRQGEAFGCSLVGLGGTATTLAAMAQGLTEYDPARVHGYILHVDVVAALTERLRQAPLEERRRMAGLQPERADIIPVGAMIALAVMQRLGYQAMHVAESDILHGLALFLVQGVERKSGAQDLN